jgi:hypothetical protein
MKIRILKSFSGYRAGQEFDWGDGMARIYIARGMAERVEERVVETAAVEERAEQATIQQPAKRRVK